MAFPNGYFRFSFRDFVIAIVSRETWWFIGVVGCCGFVVFESGWCFTWNIGFALRRPKDVNVFHVKRSRMVELSWGWCFTWNISPAYFYGWLWWWLMGRSGGVLWWFFSVWISYICSPSEGTGILEITISFMATDRCFTWNTVFWKSTQRVGKLIYTNRWELERACHRACFSLLLKVVMRVNTLGGWTAVPSNWMSLIASCFCWCFTWNVVGWGWFWGVAPLPY